MAQERDEGGASAPTHPLRNPRPYSSYHWVSNLATEGGSPELLMKQGCACLEGFF